MDSLILSIGVEYVGVIVGVGVRVMDRVGVGSGVFVNVGVAMALNVIATNVAAWSFMSISSSEPVSGTLQAVSNTQKNINASFRMGITLFFRNLRFRTFHFEKIRHTDISASCQATDGLECR